MRAVPSNECNVVVVVQRGGSTTLAARVATRRAAPRRPHRARGLGAPHAIQSLDLLTDARP